MKSGHSIWNCFQDMIVTDVQLSFEIEMDGCISYFDSID